MRIPLGDYWRLLGVYLARERTRVTVLSLLLAAGIVFQLASPQVMRAFIDTAVSGPGDTMGALVAGALLFIGIALAQQIVTVTSAYASETVAWAATNALRTDLARHCVDLDMSFHNEQRPGELIERIDGDVASLANFFSQFVIQVAGSALLMVGILAFLAREDLRLGGLMLLFAAVSLALLYRVSHLAVPHWDRAREAAADMSGYLEERLAGTEDIRSSGATSYVMRGFFAHMRTRWKAEMKAGLMVSAVVNTSMLTYAIGTAAALALSTWLFRAGSATIGTVYLIFQYTFVLLMPIERISQQLGDLQKAGAAIERIRALLGRSSRLVYPTVPEVLPPAPALEVSFDHVTFGYRPEEPVLHDVSFHVTAGRLVGLLGRTGAGKSTVARLMYRLYDPRAGVVRLSAGGCSLDIRQLDRAAVNRRVGMVTQEVQLFAATVRDNLTFFDPAPRDDELVAAIEELGLGEWYRRLPEGLDTTLAAGGGGLSAGESQLLALVRVFLGDPGLLILDEASSRLDPATERLLESALDRLCRGRTAIVIAHRLATVRRADDILILEGGRVVEWGVRADLESDAASRFSRLLETGLEEAMR